MAIIRRWRGLGVADGTAVINGTVGTGDNTFNAVTGTPTVRLMAGRDRNEIRIANDTTTHQFRWNTLNLSAWSFRCYFRSDAAPASALASILYFTHSGGRLLTLNYNTAGNVSLLNAAATVVASSPNLSPTKMYRIEVATTATAGNINLSLYECDTYGETGTLFWQRSEQAIGTTGALTQTILGRQSGGAYGPGYFSEFALSDAAGEIGTADIPDLSTLELWWGNGSSFTRVECHWGTAGVYQRLETHWPGEVVVGTRDATLQPFTSESHWNLSRGDGLILSDATDSMVVGLTEPVGDPPSPGTVNHSGFTTDVMIAEAGDPNLTIRPVATGTWGPKDTTYTDDIIIRAPATVNLAGDMLPPIANTTYTNAAGQVGGAISWTKPADGSVIKPDGFLTIIDRPTGIVTEAYKATWWPNTSGVGNPASRIIVARSGVTNQYDIRGDGDIRSGRASRAGFLTGLIREWEVALSTTDHQNAIRHVLAGAADLRRLLRPSLDVTSHPAKTVAGYQWPAFAYDGHAEGSPGYTGKIRMGTHFYLRPDFNIEASGLSVYGKALAYALRDYGVVILDASAYTSLYVEQGIGLTIGTDIKDAWQDVLIFEMRRALNNSAANPGGPGARVRPLLPALAPA